MLNNRLASQNNKQSLENAQKCKFDKFTFVAPEKKSPDQARMRLCGENVHLGATGKPRKWEKKLIHAAMRFAEGYPKFVFLLQSR